MPIDTNDKSSSHVLPVLNNNDNNNDIQYYDTVNLVTPPIYLRGRVVSGFGRGSKLLGYPTANLDPNSFTQQLINSQHGVYAGWITVELDDNNYHNNNNHDTLQQRQPTVYKTVLSIGTNPTFNDVQHPTVECYILHKFNNDFYDKHINLIIGVFLRRQEKYNSMDELINAIHTDELIGNKILDDKIQLKQLQHDKFFTQQHNT